MAEAAPTANGVRELVGAAGDAMMQALHDDDLDAASRELETIRTLTGRKPDDPDLLFFAVVIAIQRGQARDALQYLNELGPDCHPELRAMCLYSLQDPVWEGLAREVEEGGDPVAARGMAWMLASYAAAKATH